MNFEGENEMIYVERQKAAEKQTHQYFAFNLLSLFCLCFIRMMLFYVCVTEFDLFMEAFYVKRQYPSVR